DPGRAPRAREDGHEDRSDGCDRDQRGVRVGGARVGEGAPPRHERGEPERRRDRARAPDRCDGYAAHDDAARRARPDGRALGPPDDVRGRWPGQRHDRRTALLNFAFTEEQQELRDAARAFLADASSSERVRAAMASELGYDSEVWKRIGSELGWPSAI